MLIGWKTIIFNGLLMLTGVLAEFGVVLPEAFAQDVNGVILALVGVVGIALRAVTNSPIGKPE